MRDIFVMETVVKLVPVFYLPLKEITYIIKMHKEILFTWWETSQ